MNRQRCSKADVSAYRVADVGQQTESGGVGIQLQPFEPKFSRFGDVWQFVSLSNYWPGISTGADRLSLRHMESGDSVEHAYRHDGNRANYSASLSFAFC